MLRKKPEKIETDTTPFEEDLSQIRPLEFCQVRGSSHEKLFNSLIEQYHQTHRPNRSIKAVWGYPLDNKFRSRLGVS